MHSYYSPDEQGHEIPREVSFHPDEEDLVAPLEVPRSSHSPTTQAESANRQNQTRRSRTAFVVAGIFCALVVAAVVIPSVLFVVNNDDGSDQANADLLPSERKKATVVLAMQPVEEEMDALQSITFLQGCDDFFAAQFPRLENVQTQFLSQTLVSEDRRRLEEEKDQEFILQVELQVQADVPYQARLTNFTQSEVQQAVLRPSMTKGSLSLLDTLKATGEPYFEQLEKVTVEVAAATRAPTPSAITTNPNACNGLENLCDMPVNQVLFATMHNANSDASVAKLLPNHQLDMLAGLQAGIRGINVDIGFCPDGNGAQTLALVHGSCSLGYTDAVEALTRIQQFLTDNPREVILMPVQINSDTGGRVELAAIDNVFRQVVDTDNKTMKDRLYTHPRYDPSVPPVFYPWPTLGGLVEADERIIFFFYNTDETCRLDDSDCPDGFNEYFLYAAETEFEFATVEEITRDPQGACNITRGARGFRSFFGVNLFLTIPSAEAAATLNRASFLASHLQTCGESARMAPNLVSVDFWSTGDVISLTRTYNAALEPPEPSPTMVTRTPAPSTVQPTIAPPTTDESVVTPAPMQVEPPESTLIPTSSPSVTSSSPSVTSSSPSVTSSSPSVTSTVLPTPSPTLLPVQTFPPTTTITSMPTTIPVTMEPMRTQLPSSAPILGEQTLTPTASPSATPTSIPTKESSETPTVEPSTFPTATPTAELLVQSDSPTSLPETLKCNGLENLCDLPVSDILFATMHNANAQAGIILFAPNHDESILTGLEMGIRGINTDWGICNSQLSLFHSECFLGYSDPVVVLAGINQFLTDNPNEVLLMPSQLEAEVSLSDMKTLMNRAVDSNGKSFADRLYVHPGEDASWPTLRELIASDSRVLFFVYNNGDTNYPAGIHPWFRYAAETEFSFVDVDAIQGDPTGACTITRGGGGTKAFFGINVFTQLPSRSAAATLNSASFLGPHIETCSAQNSLDPNLVLVDFFTKGDVIEVVQAHNAKL